MRQNAGVQQQQSRAPTDLAVAELAAWQHGVISRRQLKRIGVSAEAIRHRLSVGRLHLVRPGVYAVGHAALLPTAHHMAAVLAVGDGAVLSRRSAGGRLGLWPIPSGPIDVTVLRGGGRRHEGLAVHVTRSLPDSDVTTVDSIPCTAWARTLVDVAATMSERQLGRALERSIELRMFDRSTMDATLSRSQGKRGTGRLRRLLTDLLDDTPPTASELEWRFLDLVRAAALPYPVVNGHIGALQVDFHWPDYKVVVETDGRATHEHRIAFHRDRDRDLYLQEQDWRVLRLTWRQIVDEPQRVVTALRRLLQSR